MNGDDLVAAFRDLPIDYTPPFRWDDDKILAWMNEAEREAAIRGKLIYDRDTESVCKLTLVPGQRRYRLSPLIDHIVCARHGGRRLHAYDREELDRLDDDWRDSTSWSAGYVFDDTHIELVGVASELLGDVWLDVYRLPLQDFGSTSSPEIAEIHHTHLVDWAAYRALSTEDFEERQVMDRSADLYLARFERYFGAKPSVNIRRRQHANRPHAVKGWA